MELEEIKKRLSDSLKQYALEVVSTDGERITLVKKYSIEIENPHLFKLIHEGYVVAPFHDIDEMCNFIKMDMALNEED